MIMIQMLFKRKNKISHSEWNKKVLGRFVSVFYSREVEFKVDSNENESENSWNKQLNFANDSLRTILGSFAKNHTLSSLNDYNQIIDRNPQISELAITRNSLEQLREGAARFSIIDDINKEILPFLTIKSKYRTVVLTSLESYRSHAILERKLRRQIGSSVEFNASQAACSKSGPFLAVFDKLPNISLSSAITL